MRRGSLLGKGLTPLFDLLGVGDHIVYESVVGQAAAIVSGVDDTINEQLFNRLLAISAAGQNNMEEITGINNYLRQIFVPTLTKAVAATNVDVYPEVYAFQKQYGLFYKKTSGELLHYTLKEITTDLTVSDVRHDFGLFLSLTLHAPFYASVTQGTEEFNKLTAQHTASYQQWQHDKLIIDNNVTTEAFNFSERHIKDLFDFIQIITYAHEIDNKADQLGIVRVGGTGDKWVYQSNILTEQYWIAPNGNKTHYVIFGANDAVLGDRINGGDQNDRIYGGKGDDQIYGGSGNDIIEGNADNDTLYGDAGNDNVLGGAGNDELYGGEGADFVIGGEGADTLWGEAGNDLVVGGVGNDIAFGGADNDIVYTGVGDDTVDGGDGNDIIDAGQGADSIDGGGGRDVIDVSTTNINKKYVFGGDGGDVLLGSQLNDWLQGGSGRDYLDGGNGDDTLDGGWGDNGDVLLGGSGNDKYIINTLNGGATLIKDADGQGRIQINGTIISGGGI